MRMRSIAALLTVALFSSISSAQDGEHWPSFRGPYAKGVADGQNLPVLWDATKNQGLRYKVAVPGLAHSSPIVFGENIYLTTAVSSEKDASFQPGLYGSGDASEDRSVHEWQVICLDKSSGEILWKKTATKGVPRDKRHIKATYANSTPATDGRHVVAFFGSQGLFCFDARGKVLWQRDLGRLDVGAYDLPSYEWGSASSPIIHAGKVFVQCDTQNDSFLIALDVQTGETVWNIPREELPSWGTPTFYPGGEGQRPELITNGSNFIRGYDPATGEELWRLGGSSKITAPTPIFWREIFVVASGRSPERPIFAIRAGANGDITLSGGASSSESVAWSLTRRGPYMPTPLIYQDRLYVLSNDGPFACYDLNTGDEIYRLRLPHRGDGFSASPVASDGRIYLAGESGNVFVVKAGDEFELLATHAVGEPMMATPAISGGMLLIRGSKHLFAIGAE